MCCTYRRKYKNHMESNGSAQCSLSDGSSSEIVSWFVSLAGFELIRDAVIVLNMFIAVIQENFDVTEDEKRMHQVKSFLQNKSYKAPSQGLKFDFWGRNKNKRPEVTHSKQAAFEMLTKQAIVESFLDEGEQHDRAVCNIAHLRKLGFLLMNFSL